MENQEQGQEVVVNNVNVIVQEPSQIEEVLKVIENIDLNVLESTKQIEDIELRRNEIGKHLIEVAKNLSLMKGVKSPSTMREKVYDVIAAKTSASKKLFAKFSLNVSILDNVTNLDKLIEATKWKIKK